MYACIQTALFWVAFAPGYVAISTVQFVCRLLRYCCTRSWSDGESDTDYFVEPPKASVQIVRFVTSLFVYGCCLFLVGAYRNNIKVGDVKPDYFVIFIGAVSTLVGCALMANCANYGRCCKRKIN